MTPIVSARDRRALRWGGAFVIAALMFVLLLRPWMTAVDGELQQLSAERHLLARELGIVGSGSNVERRLRNASGAAQSRLSRLFASDPAGASADFQAYVSREAVSSRLFVESAAASSQVAGARSLRKLRLDVEGVTDFEGSLEMLRRLETGPHLVIVEALRLESRSPESSPMVNLPTTDLPLVSLEAQLASFVLGDSASDSASVPIGNGTP